MDIFFAWVLMIAGYGGSLLIATYKLQPLLTRLFHLDFRRANFRLSQRPLEHQEAVESDVEETKSKSKRWWFAFAVLLFMGYLAQQHIF